MPGLRGFSRGWRKHRASAFADPTWRAFASRHWRGLTLRKFLLQASNVGKSKASVAMRRSSPPQCASSGRTASSHDQEPERAVPRDSQLPSPTCIGWQDGDKGERPRACPLIPRGPAGPGRNRAGPARAHGAWSAYWRGPRKVNGPRYGISVAGRGAD